MPTPRERLRVSLVRVGFSLMNKEPQVAQDARRGSIVRVVRRFARSVVRASTLVPLIQLLAQIAKWETMPAVLVTKRARNAQ